MDSPSSKKNHPQIDIVEVGARDGLQSAHQELSFEQKKNFLNYLLACGFQHIEAGSFVRFDKIPQMQDTPKLAQYFEKENFWYLVPNTRGLEAALDCGVKNIAFFTAASDGFNQKNIGQTVSQSLKNIEAMVDSIQNKGFEINENWDENSPQKIKLRLYISTVIYCPYDGLIQPQKTKKILTQLQSLPICQYSLGDTLGKAVPNQWQELLEQLDPQLINTKIAMHCHDTYGTALACVQKGLDYGVRVFDSSIGGLGGCPYAPGALGNVATEDLIYFLETSGFSTGIDLKKLARFFTPERTANLKNLSHYFLTKNN